MKIGDVEVSTVGKSLRWTSGLAIDCDGAPNAYAPIASGLHGLDYLANAGSAGKWWGLVCDSTGQPIVQGPLDLAPGFYISPTALVDRSFGVRNPKRYVDASKVPYIAMPPDLRAIGARLGDVAMVFYGGRSCAAVVADIGPRNKIGEGSPALAKVLGINADGRNGGTSDGVSFYLFAGSALGWPRSNNEVRIQAEQLYAAAVMVS